ncbi:MAG: tetratricopeptide repeat protein [Myxococcaceae bacterium]|nr:tetratricopeptide repeat protein [Myxococcaceae bacterium]
MKRSVALVCLWLLACKDPETQAKEQHAATVAALTAQARAELEAGRGPAAGNLVAQLIALEPEEIEPHVLMAQAHALMGNAPAALLSLGKAEQLAKEPRPELMHQRAKLLLGLGRSAEAMDLLLKLRDSDALQDSELLELARLQLRARQHDAAMKTLAVVQTKSPDDADAKVVEAEILLATPGSEILAAKLMDRLLKQDPSLVAARELRARYFLHQGYPDLALQDLAVLPEGKRTPMAAELTARALLAQKKVDEAVAVLEPLTREGSTEAELITALAEIRLDQADISAARELADRALVLQPQLPSALVLRGRALEADGEASQAEDQFRMAVSLDPSYAPALSALWPRYLERGENGEALACLERLDRAGKTSPKEQLALARLAADTGHDVDRAKKLVEALLKSAPKDGELLKLRARLAKLGRPAGTGGIQIIRGH